MSAGISINLLYIYIYIIEMNTLKYMYFREYTVIHNTVDLFAYTIIVGLTLGCYYFYMYKYILYRIYIYYFRLYSCYSCFV